MNADLHERMYRKLELLSEFVRSFHEKTYHEQVQHAFDFLDDMLNRAMIPYETIPSSGFTFDQKVERALICKIITLQEHDECLLLAGVADIFSKRKDVDFESRIIDGICARLTLFVQYTADTPDNREKYLTSIHSVAMRIYHNYVH